MASRILIITQMAKHCVYRNDVVVQKLYTFVSINIQSLPISTLYLSSHFPIWNINGIQEIFYHNVIGDKQSEP